MATTQAFIEALCWSYPEDSEDLCEALDVFRQQRLNSCERLLRLSYADWQRLGLPLGIESLLRGELAAATPPAAGAATTPALGSIAAPASSRPARQVATGRLPPPPPPPSQQQWSAGSSWAEERGRWGKWQWVREGWKSDGHRHGSGAKASADSSWSGSGWTESRGGKAAAGASWRAGSNAKRHKPEPKPYRGCRAGAGQRGGKNTSRKVATKADNSRVPAQDEKEEKEEPEESENLEEQEDDEEENDGVEEEDEEAEIVCFLQPTAKACPKPSSSYMPVKQEDEATATSACESVEHGTAAAVDQCAAHQGQLVKQERAAVDQLPILQATEAAGAAPLQALSLQNQQMFQQMLQAQNQQMFQHMMQTQNKHMFEELKRLISEKQPHLQLEEQRPIQIPEDMKGKILTNMTEAPDVDNCCIVSVADVGFTQNSIADYFQGCGRKLGELIEALQNGWVDPLQDKFMQLLGVKLSRRLLSLDNRRLYCLKAAQAQCMKMRIVGSWEDDAAMRKFLQHWDTPDPSTVRVRQHSIPGSAGMWM